MDNRVLELCHSSSGARCGFDLSGQTELWYEHPGLESDNVCYHNRLTFSLSVFVYWCYAA